MTTPVTILVVDDDPACLDIATHLLEREGFRVRATESGEGCLRIASREPFDLILLDVMMPGMDGFEVRTALRDAGRRIPVILLTARDDIDARFEGIAQGIVEYLTKPINKHELLARVRAQLHILELGRQLEAVERNLHAARQDPGARH
jgi:DNA-binding response OmpR family regulator